MLEMEVYMLVFTCPAGVTVKPDWIMFAIFLDGSLILTPSPLQEM